MYLTVQDLIEVKRLKAIADKAKEMKPIAKNKIEVEIKIYLN